MQTTPRRNGFALLAFGLAMFVIITLALASTTWAAPNAQGTVPTPVGGKTATAAPTSSGGGKEATPVPTTADNGGGGSDNGGGVQPTAASVGAGSVCAIGDTGAQCAAPDLAILVGAGAATAGSALTIEGSFPQPPCPASPAGDNFLNRCFRYAWIGTDAQPLKAINAPVQYCISYGAEQLAAVEGKAENFLVGVAGADGSWTLLKPTLDAQHNRTCATSNQLIVWNALFGPQKATQVLPTVGGQFDPWAYALLAGLGIVLLAGAAQFRRKAK